MKFKNKNIWDINYFSVLVILLYYYFWIKSLVFPEFFGKYFSIFNKKCTAYFCPKLSIEFIENDPISKNCVQKYVLCFAILIVRSKTYYTVYPIILLPFDIVLYITIG